MTPQTAPSTPPCNPCGLDSHRQAKVQVVEGSAKQALETGRSRLLVAGLAFALAFLIIGLRLVEVSALGQGREPRLAEEPTAPSLVLGRADIVDRNGMVLATTLPTASLYANPRQVRAPHQLAQRLAAVLPSLDAKQTAARLASDRAFVWLKRNLTPRQQALVNDLGAPGLNFQRETKRVYPHGSLAAHIVGFTDIDNRGIAGAERAFDERLRGATEPLALSLDLRIQHIVAEELAASIERFDAIGAAGLALDVETGELLAMASLPSFDPKEPAAADEERLFNRASLGIYEMGSVFKIFTAAMALDSGMVALDDSFDVSRPIKVSRYTIRDFKPRNRSMTVPEILIYSSNIGTVQMAMAAGTQRQQRFLERLGLLRPSGLELMEIGDPLKPAVWREINTMTISYGHGLAVSPVQLVSAVAAVVNGGALKPATLLRREAGDVPAGRQVIDPETSDVMRWLMRLVVQHGTGRKGAAEGYMVGGKTGTAEKTVGRRYADDARIASFVGAFPMDRPRFVVFAMIDEPKGRKDTHGYATGGWVAAPAVRRVIERMAPLLGMQARPAEETEGADVRLVPASHQGFTLAAHRPG